MLGIHPNDKVKLDQQVSIILNSTLTFPKRKVETATKDYVDSLHENSRDKRDMSKVFNDQTFEFNINNLTKVDSITVSTVPTTDNEFSTKKK